MPPSVSTGSTTPRRGQPRRPPRNRASNRPSPASPPLRSSNRAQHGLLVPTSATRSTDQASAPEEPRRDPTEKKALAKSDSSKQGGAEEQWRWGGAQPDGPRRLFIVSTLPTVPPILCGPIFASAKECTCEPLARRRLTQKPVGVSVILSMPYCLINAQLSGLIHELARGIECDYLEIPWGFA
jgi:hypothetical protein